MAVRKDETKNKWLAEAYINGKRRRKWFNTKAEANLFYRSLKEKDSPLAQALAQIKKPTKGKKLSEMVQIWYELHGKTLGAGKDIYRKGILIAQAVGDPYAERFTAEMFVEYRAKRLNGEIIFAKRRGRDKPASCSSLNTELQYINAIINELRRLKKWQGPNPLADIRSIRQKELALTFLRSQQIIELLRVAEGISQDLLLIIKLCLATGARWGEVQKLQAPQVLPYKVTFTQTKSGKNRTVPISQELYEQLPLERTGSLFQRSYDHFRRAIKEAKIALPEGQNTHVLRHTFASHFMMNNGNILVLKEILGHSDIKMTMKYAHFSPSHLESALALNPLENLNLKI